MDFKKAALMDRIGDISQVGGLRHYQLLDGYARGVEAIDFRTGAGLCFTVLPSRCMDIAWGDYKSVAIPHITKAGVLGPQYYEKEGLGWLRTFFAGMLTTCGLMNVGWACEDDVDHFGLGQVSGLHGRISTTPAENVCVTQGWVGDEFVMRASGRMRQASFKAENYMLTREITSILGRNEFTLHDVIENNSRAPLPLMLLYHFNFGHPFLDESTEFVSNSHEVKPEDEVARAGLESYATYGPLQSTFPDQVFHHDLKPADLGQCTVGLVNHDLGLGVSIRFDKNELPHLAQWKVLSKGDYITGIEPANCYAEGCNAARKNGRLETIEPGEMREFTIHYGIMEGTEAIGQFKRQVKV